MDTLDELVRFSNFYGSNKELVLAGGGNTSAKSDGYLFVKASGCSLAGIDKSGFVKIDLSLVEKIFEKEYPADDDAREAAAFGDLMAARATGEEKRPSVETSLHALFPQTFVLHLHPALVNGLACAVKGKVFADEIFAGEYIWVDSCKPGYILAKLCQNLILDYEKSKGKSPQIILLQNHGIFFAADSLEELESLVNTTLAALKAKVKFFPTLGEEKEPDPKALTLIEGLKRFGALKGEAVYCANDITGRFLKSKEATEVLMLPFTPDHIVYCGAYPLYVSHESTLEKDYEAYLAQNKTEPKIIIIEACGFLALGKNEKAALTVRDVFIDAMKIALYSENFGGPDHMTQELIDFIINWEVESYRQKQN